MIAMTSVKNLHGKQRSARREHPPDLWNDRDQIFFIAIIFAFEIFQTRSFSRSKIFNRPVLKNFSAGSG